MKAVTSRTTANGQPVVELWDESTLVLKAYPSPDGAKIRIVLPELADPAQCLGELHRGIPYVEFTRRLKIPIDK